MMEIIDSTDKKHIGEKVDETLPVIVFKNGGKMAVVGKMIDGKQIILYNSNYQIRLGE